MNKQQIFYDFLVEYAQFLESMVGTEEEKLQVLLSNKLPELEKSIAVQQTVEMKIVSLEKKRIALQKEAGFGDMVFSEIVNQAAGEKKAELATLFDRVQKAVTKIKFLNAKSMDILKMNVQTMNMGSKSTSYGYSKDQKEVFSGRKSILETKI